MEADVIYTISRLMSYLDVFANDIEDMIVESMVMLYRMYGSNTGQWIREGLEAELTDTSVSRFKYEYLLERLVEAENILGGN